MLKVRVIAVILIKDGEVIQSEKFNHTNVIHSDAYHAVEAYNSWSVDEIVLLNVSKSKASQKNFLKIVNKVSKTCFVPLAVGGHIDSLDYGSSLVSSGGDKLVINSLWNHNIEVVRDLSKKFGKQCIVSSIDIKENNKNQKEVLINRGTQSIGVDVARWAKYCEKNGAGEILLNNIDYDGNRKGYDLDSISIVSKCVQIPVIAFGGVFHWSHMIEGLQAGADAVAAANIFHYKEMATKQAKKYLKTNNIAIRE